jgi:hypothetical protein
MPPPNTPTVLACSTDKDPERQPLTIPITTKLDARRRVVMALGPGEYPYSSMPDLAPGDRIEVSAELEVTTDAEVAGSDCVGKPYHYNPRIKARLLLADSPNATARAPTTAVALGSSLSTVCTHEQHHHIVVFSDVSYTVGAAGLPWTGDSYLNLVVSAHHPRAKRGHVLLIGQNEPGSGGGPAYAKGDMGKINVVRYRGQPEPSGKVKSTTRIRNSQVPIRKQPTVVYSLRLGDLRKDEQLLMQAKMKSSNPHAYKARVSTQVVLTDSANGTGLHGSARDYAALKGEIGKYNGCNCLPGDTCTTRKFGTLRMLKDVTAPLFATLVVTSAAPPPGHAQAGDTLKILSGGALTVTRLPPEVTG